MPNHIRSLMTCVAAACLAVALAGPAHAQSSPPPPTSPDFMSRYDFHLSGAALAIDDQRFSWDTHFGGEADILDYVVGRASVAIDYEAVLGDEFRAFDPNQSYYTLEVSGSVRARGNEVAGVFHHVSRHLSDRPKVFAIAWNELGAQFLRRVAVRDTAFDIRAGLGTVIQHSYVDYSWIADLDVLVHRPINQHVGVFARGVGELYGTDDEVSHRGTQRGGRAEVGLRLNGSNGAVELFAGVERRVDADPIDRLPKRWALAGFRFASR